MSTMGNDTAKGLLWSFVERFSMQGIQFLVELVLARLLMPEDFGVIGMLTIFLALSRALIDSGFSNALIRNNKRTDEDYQTTFWFNNAISLTLYLILFVTAPIVAKFYNFPILVPVLRIYALSLIINSLSAVSRTILVIRVDFKKQAIITTSSTFLSGIIGIVLAYLGYGVWALVWYSLCNYIFQSILYFTFVNWHPKFVFSKKSFQDQFGYGSKILAATLISTLYDNLYNIVIGKKYTVEDLGYYSKSDSLVKFPSNNIAGILTRVTLPVMSKMQDDTAELLRTFIKFLHLSVLVSFPLMVGLVVLAKPLIIVLYTEKWLGMTLIFQLLCMDWIWDVVCKINMNLL